MCNCMGVNPVVKEGRKTTDALLNNAVATAVETGRVSNGDLIIITAGVPTGEKRNYKYDENPLSR